MKTLLPLIAFIFIFSNTTIAQDDLEIGDVVKFTSPVSHLKSDHSKKELLIKNSNVVNLIEPKYLFTFMGCENDTCRVTAKPFTNKGWDFDRRKYYNNKVFEISSTQFKSKFERVEETGAVTIGVLTLPFRVRMQEDWSFETSFNLGVTAGIHLKNNFFFQIGTQIGSSEISSSNAKIEDGKSITASTLSLVSGIMYEYKRAQIGVYFGADLINNQTEYKWIHHGKPWFSLGIGFDVYKIGTAKKTN